MNDVASARAVQRSLDRIQLGDVALLAANVSPAIEREDLFDPPRIIRDVEAHGPIATFQEEFDNPGANAPTGAGHKIRRAHACHRNAMFVASRLPGSGRIDASTVEHPTIELGITLNTNSPRRHNISMRNTLAMSL
jgi:hypothetical protein